MAEHGTEHSLMIVSYPKFGSGRPLHSDRRNFFHNPPHPKIRDRVNAPEMKDANDFSFIYVTRIKEDMRQEFY